LGGHAASAHAKEAEVPIEQVEEHGANSYTTYESGIGDMSDDSSIN
jgi:hypothetical protein